MGNVQKTHILRSVCLYGVAYITGVASRLSRSSSCQSRCR